MTSVFDLLTALEKAERNLETAKFIDNWQRSQIVEKSARADVKWLSEKIAREDLFALPPLERTETP